MPTKQELDTFQGLFSKFLTIPPVLYIWEFPQHMGTTGFKSVIQRRSGSNFDALALMPIRLMI